MKELWGHEAQVYRGNPSFVIELSVEELKQIHIVCVYMCRLVVCACVCMWRLVEDNFRYHPQGHCQLYF